jgi:hypothetical protein
VRIRVARAGGYPIAVGRLGGRASAAAAAYLGVPRAQLRAELRAGRTLAAVAQATRGKSASGLIAAIVSGARLRLDASVAAGRLTAAREKLLLAMLERRVAAQVSSARP